MFFHKNKRKSAFCTKRIAFCALFLVGIIAGVTILILKVNAQLVPVASVEIASSHSNYENGDPGAWKVTKSATWTDVGKAKITFEVKSIPKYDDSKKHDVVMVIDVSGSMNGNKIAQVKADASDLVDALLSNADNRVALVTFESQATIISHFTNDKTQMVNHINSISTKGCTNYYDGLVKAKEVLDGYTPQDSRELILLFLTDGYPNESVPNEKAQYAALKQAYPYMTINGIQYEMGDIVLQPIIDVSDNQFIADMSSLNNTLFEATVTPYSYDEFILTDYVDDTYWTVAGLDALKASLGEMGLEYDGSTPKITWNLSGLLHSGKTATLSIDINLNGIYQDIEDLLLPTNKHESIQTKIDDTPDENIDSTGTPILKDAYNVIYDANVPEGCELTGTVPDTASYVVFSSVEISSNNIYCQNYIFKGWRISTDGVKRINDDYFRMPGKDVYITAIWAMASISKSMDGALHTRATAKLDYGRNVNYKLKMLADSSVTSAYTQDNNVSAIIKSDQAPAFAYDVDIPSTNIISGPTSDVPVYAWYEEGTIYYYSEADDIYMNENSENLFYNFRSLSDISGLQYLNSSRTTTMSSLLDYCNSITSLDILSKWDVSKVTNFSRALGHLTSLQNLSGLEEWDTSSATNMYGMFYYDSAITNVDELENWNLTSVNNIGSMFEGASNLVNVDGLAKWDVSNAQIMYYLFARTSNLSDISGVYDWDTSSATNMDYMFQYNTSLTNIDYLAKWNTSNVKKMNSMFYNATALVDIDGALGWNVSNVTNMAAMFSQAIALQNIDGAINWNTEKVEDMSRMFSGASSLASIAGAINWKTGNVNSMDSMFYDAKSLTNIDSAINWDTSKVTTMYMMFQGASKLTNIDGAINWNVEKVETMYWMFTNDSSLENVDGAINWRTPSLKTIDHMFASTKLTNVDALANFDVSNVTSFEGVFSYAGSLTNVDGLLNWDVSRAKTFNNLFMNAKSLNNIDGLRRWDVSNATGFANIFSSNGALSDISALANWTTTNATTFAGTFNGAKLITDLTPIRGWDTSKVTSLYNTFRGASSLSSLSPISDWDVSQVTSMYGTFASMPRIQNLDDLSGWDVSSVTSMYEMFIGDAGLTDISGISNWTTTSLTSIAGMFGSDVNITDLSPLEGWDITNLSNVKNAFNNIPETIARPSWYAALATP